MIKLDVNKAYRKLQIRRGDYFRNTRRDTLFIKYPDAYRKETIELDEDAVQAWLVLGEVLEESGISLERVLAGRN